ncbi:response regulator [Caloramator sp. E03]|nr:response regulator [Caloramator sp. E03]
MMCMKAIIADDEIWVCKLIEKLIDWDKLGIKIVAEVDNGIDAYNAILNEKPYIVITDIRMPGIDGLELIKKVRESGIETNFIIISGHKQFEYAQNAVRYGVEDYLLKPINKEELLNILIKLRDRYFINNKKLEEEMMIRKQLTYNIGRIRKQFLYNILLNINNVEDTDINKINNEYNFNFKSGKFQGIILKVDKKNNEDINENYENIILNKLCEIVKKNLKEICQDIETINFNKRVVCILNYCEEKSNLMKKIYKKIFEDVKNYLEIQEYFYLTMAFGLVADNIKFIPDSLKSALDLINCRVVLGIDKTLDASNFNLGCVNISELLTVEKEISFTNYIESFDKKGIETWINDFFNSVRFKIEEDPLIIFKGYNKIIEIFFDTMKKTDFQYEDYIKEKIYKK